MAFTPILYENEEVGKRVKSSKIKHTWVLEVSGTVYTVDYFDSRASKKSRIVLNEVEIHKGKKQGGEVNVPFRLGNLPVSLVGKGALVDLLVTNRYFKHVLNEIQANPPAMEPEFEEDFPDHPPPSKPVPVQSKPVPQPSKPEVRPNKPVEVPAKPIVKPQESAPEKKKETTDLLSGVFDGPVNPYPALYEDPFQVKAGQGKAGEESAPTAHQRMPSAPGNSTSADFDLLGESIKAKPQQADPVPSQSVPVMHQIPAPGGMYQGQMGGMQGQVGGMPGQVGGMPGQVGGMQGQVGGMQGQMGGMPGQMGGMQGQMGGMQGQMGGMQGQMGGWPMHPGQGAVGPMQYQGQPMPYAPQMFATGYQQPVNPAAFASQQPSAAISTGLDFFTPHAGLIDSDVLLAKNNRFAPEAQVLQRGNPFSVPPPSQDFPVSPDLENLVDFNLSNPYTPAQYRQYQEHMKGVEVKGSDPSVAMKDLPKRGANNPFG